MNENTVSRRFFKMTKINIMQFCNGLPVMYVMIDYCKEMQNTSEQS